MKKVFTCESCSTKGCRSDDKYPDFCITKKIGEEKTREVLKDYEYENIKNIMKTSATVEGQNYLKMTRVEETVDFIKRMDYKLVGIATCISMLKETKAFCRVLDSHNIEYRVASCKVGAIDKKEVGIREQDRLRKEEPHESMCNPIMQAKYLEEEGTELNVVIGLCIGHDSLFYMHSKSPVTTLIVKDRVTCHNPAAPLYNLDGIYSKILK
jgi:uncharacterized metal-binding protein